MVSFLYKTKTNYINNKNETIIFWWKGEIFFPQLDLATKMQTHSGNSAGSTRSAGGTSAKSNSNSNSNSGGSNHSNPDHSHSQSSDSVYTL